jgi:hypothetical protein
MLLFVVPVKVILTMAGVERFQSCLVVVVQRFQMRRVAGGQRLGMFQKYYSQSCLAIVG